jgi:NADPH:quinone reductase-like Zn-dependent oxidoreductase
MQAIVQHRYGGPEVLMLEEVAKPSPGPGDVLIRVRAASLFFGDRAMIRGRPLIVRTATGLRRPRQPIPGIDVAGVVEAVGTDVVEHAPGDEVFGFVKGALAQYACAPADHFVRKPSTLDFAEAAAAPEAGLTALQGLRDAGGLVSGQTTLIIGASGGVGTFAVQIARAMGASVTAVCSTRNVDLVRSIGAEHVIDYTAEDLIDRPERYDLILQTAGTASPNRLRRLLRPGGTLVLSDGEGRLAGIDRILAATVLDPFVRERLVVFLTRENQADLAALRDLIEAGAVRPVIDRSYPLADAPKALAYLEAGHTQGKVVITA